MRNLLTYNPIGTKRFELQRFVRRMARHHVVFPDSCTKDWCKQKIRNRAKRMKYNIDPWQISLLFDTSVTTARAEIQN